MTILDRSDRKVTGANVSTAKNELQLARRATTDEVGEMRRRREGEKGRTGYDVFSSSFWSAIVYDFWPGLLPGQNPIPAGGSRSIARYWKRTSRQNWKTNDDRNGFTVEFWCSRNQPDYCPSIQDSIFLGSHQRCLCEDQNMMLYREKCRRDNESAAITMSFQRQRTVHRAQLIIGTLLVLQWTSITNIGNGICTEIARQFE